jgi:alkylation response protein AidB-like acyl-CoA dehydrogenase
VREWCEAHVPRDWRAAQAGASDAEFVRFQQWWFAELRAAGYAVPHWPARWGGGMSAAEQAILYAELAAHDAPRLVLHFVAIHHAAATLVAAGTEEQRQRHLPAILAGGIWAQGFSEPDAGSDLAALRTAARRDGDHFVVNGQKLWASGAAHAGWCLLLARSDPGAPKRKGISYFLLDLRSPGVEVRPVRNAVGEWHFCEIFLTDVAIPAANLIGPENEGWRVAQETLGAERGMTMLELAERLGNAGFRWLVQACADAGALGDSLVADRLAAFETEITALRAMTARLVASHDSGSAAARGSDPPLGASRGGDLPYPPPGGPADASVVKLYYSELLQRMTGFGAEVAGLPAHAVLRKPASSGWESGAWLLDFIGSWEWTIPGGSSEIQRTIIAERGLGLPRGLA